MALNQPHHDHDVRDRRRRFAKFLRFVMLLTLAAHLPFAAAIWWLVRRLEVAHALIVTAVVLGSIAEVLRLRIPRIAADRAARGWHFYVLDGPVLVHWCAAMASAIPVALCLVIDGLLVLARGRGSDVLGLIAVGSYATMLCLAAWGIFVRRRRVRIREIEVHLSGLAKELEGYRIVQLSDLHIGSVTPPRAAETWVRLANEARPDLVAVTGDLVATGDAYHGEVVRSLGGLRARDGVFVVMGNHDYMGDGEALIALLRQRGIGVLRNEGMMLSRGPGHLHIAGVDDRRTNRSDVNRALQGRRAGTPTILLAHDPSVFRAAARLGVDLVLAGHTHGGQVAFPFMARKLSLSSFTYRHHLGLYRDGGSTLYVHPGLGTTGPPIRLGVAPEITVLVLRRTDPGEVALLTTSVDASDEQAPTSVGTDTHARGVSL